MTTSTNASAAVHITGGVPLKGSCEVQGSKNIALHLYAVGPLLDSPLTLTGAPQILDTAVCAQILTATGTPATWDGRTFLATPGTSNTPAIPDELGARVRTTAVMAAAVLSRAGQVRFPLPGGDAFAARYIDRHLVAMQQAGAEVCVDRGRVHAWARGKLRPFRFDAATRSWGPSLGATVTALLLAARTPGTSVIDHPSIEPEVTAVADLLRHAGATVEWEGTTSLHITGAGGLSGLTCAVPPDRIEAATLVFASAVTGGSIHLANCPPSTFPDGLSAVLADTGLSLVPRGAGTDVTAAGPPRPVTAQTGPHPGLPTDTQPQLTAYLTQADGRSRITELLYTSRSTHIQGLRAMGADVQADGPRIVVKGRSRLQGTRVEAADIRAVTALVIAALVAEGTSTIRGMYHLQRGYGALLPKLAALGALVTTTQDNPTAPAGPTRRR